MNFGLPQNSRQNCRNVWPIAWQSGPSSTRFGSRKKINTQKTSRNTAGRATRKTFSTPRWRCAQRSDERTQQRRRCSPSCSKSSSRGSAHFPWKRAPSSPPRTVSPGNPQRGEHQNETDKQGHSGTALRTGASHGAPIDPSRKYAAARIKYARERARRKPRRSAIAPPKIARNQTMPPKNPGKRTGLLGGRNSAFRADSSPATQTRRSRKGARKFR